MTEAMPLIPQAHGTKAAALGLSASRAEGKKTPSRTPTGPTSAPTTARRAPNESPRKLMTRGSATSVSTVRAARRVKSTPMNQHLSHQRREGDDEGEGGGPGRPERQLLAGSQESAPRSPSRRPSRNGVAKAKATASADSATARSS